jgi:hypothetical protein
MLNGFRGYASGNFHGSGSNFNFAANAFERRRSAHIMMSELSALNSYAETSGDFGIRLASL